MFATQHRILGGLGGVAILVICSMPIMLPSGYGLIAFALRWYLLTGALHPHWQIMKSCIGGVVHIFRALEFEKLKELPRCKMGRYNLCSFFCFCCLEDLHHQLEHQQHAPQDVFARASSSGRHQQRSHAHCGHMCCRRRHSNSSSAPFLRTDPHYQSLRMG